MPDEVKPILIFTYYPGCRNGESLSLKWSQVDLAERLVRLDPGTTKNDEERIIPMAPELVEVLKESKAVRDAVNSTAQWVFARGGEPITDFRGAWVAACKESELVDADGKPTRIFHDLRRTGVRNLVRAGVPERVAMAISGHTPHRL